MFQQKKKTKFADVAITEKYVLSVSTQYIAICLSVCNKLSAKLLQYVALKSSMLLVGF